jgi:TM2 domain-containing membrane protein YozV
MNKAFLVLLMMLFTGKLFSGQSNSFLPTVSLRALDTLSTADTSRLRLSEEVLIKRFPKMDEAKRKKLLSAALAFPFPFGFMGAHRVMLGCKPWVPVVYVATFGGCFGLIPLIDFIVILNSKDLSEFENNPKVFMWLK